MKGRITNIPVAQIRAYEGSHHTEAVMEMIKESIQKFGLQQPVVVDKHNVVVAGNAVYKAAVALGKKELPCIVVDDLTEEEVAQYRIADNKTGEFATWNEKKLKQELSYLSDPNELQFCFDENIMRMLGMENGKPAGQPSEAPREAGELGGEEEENAPIRREEHRQAKAPTEEQKQTFFKEELKRMEEAMEVRQTEYFQYTCGQCGRIVRVRKQ